MKTNLNFLFLLLLTCSSIFAQVKIGDNPTSVGASSLLELESTNKGLVVTRVANTAAITTAVNGMIVYDLSANCLKVYQNGAWSDCMNTSTAAPSVTVVCTGFSGSYCTSALSGTNYVVTLTNNDFSAKQVTPLTADLVLSGMTGVSVASVSPSTVTTINAGGNLVITYTLSGTPSTQGTLTGSFAKQGLTCSSTVGVVASKAVTAASSAPNVCNNTALTAITHTTSGAAIGIGTATGLPAGVTVSWASNTITISGTPTASGTFTYSIPVNGCGSTVNATGTITVTESRTVAAASSTPTLCNNTALTAITHTTTAATGIGTVTGLPAGVTASWASNTITISGTPTASGTFTYSIPLTGGGCGTVNATGTITVSPGPGNYTLAGTAITRSGSTVTRFTANWTALAGATGYTLEYSTTASGPWTAFASNPYTGTSAAVTGLNALFYYFRVTSIGGTCAGSQASQEVGCGANVGGTFKTFMCYNLGVTGTQDALSYQSGANNGALYQWGRQTDGHEVRTSLTQAGPVAAPVASKFITNSTSPNDWISPQNNSLWLDASKTANDPCPTGFRVPTQAQWGGLFRGGTTFGAPGTATQNTWTWTGNGYTVGANLFLPAAGYRNVNDATLYEVGTFGSYWSSTVTGTNAYALSFISGTVNPGNNDYRGYGFSVRCITE